MAREKAGDKTRHVKFPDEVDNLLQLYAEANSRSVAEQIVLIVEEHLRGPRILRLTRNQS